MLRAKCRKLTHPLLGQIFFDERFSKILDMPCFFNLRYLSQLGCLQFSPEFIAANRSRLQHSVGVYGIMQNLLHKIQNMIPLEIEFSNNVKDAMLLAALSHDIGHLPFSHTLERKDQISHEKRSIQILLEHKDKINEIFDYDIISLVITILGDDSSCECKNSTDDLISCKILRPLLDGPIDCDRLEYVRTDRWTLFGIDKNFESIFDYLSLSYINDIPTISFMQKSIPEIISFLKSRMNLYYHVYNSDFAIVPELALRAFELYSLKNNSDITTLSESEITAKLSKFMVDKEASLFERRCAEIILRGARDKILFRKFNDTTQFQKFLFELQKYIPEELIFTETKKIEFYSGGIFIKEFNKIVDFSELINISYTKTLLHFIFVDIELCQGICNSSHLKKLFNTHTNKVC